MVYLARGNGFQVTAAEGDEGLVGRVVPVDGGLDFGPEPLAVEQGMEDADAVEIKTVRVGREVLEKFRQGIGRGNAPEMFLPGGNQLADLFVGGEGMAEARADVAAVDAGDPGGVGVIRAREIGERLGENSRGIGIGRGNAPFHELLQTSAEDGEDGEGAIGKEEIAQDLEPDDDELDGVFALKGLGVPDQGERAATGERGVQGVIRFNFPQGGPEAGGKAGELVPGAVANPEDDDAGWEPTGVPPLGIGFGVESEVHPEIDVGNDGPADLAVPALGRPDFLQGGGEVFPGLGGVGRVAGAGAAGGEAGRSGGQAFGRRASTAFQSTKLRNSSM